MKVNTYRTLMTLSISFVVQRSATKLNEASFEPACVGLQGQGNGLCFFETHTGTQVIGDEVIVQLSFPNVIRATDNLLMSR